MGEKGEGIKKYLKLSQNSCGDIKYSMGNIVNNSLITVYVWCQMGVRFIRMIT